MNNLIKKYGKEKIWVNWKLEKKDGRPTKVPYDVNTGRRASSTNPMTWTTYELAKSTREKIGIVLHNKLLVCIDIDHVLIDGKLDNTHTEKEKIAGLVFEADTFTEISQSNTGLHVFLALTAPLNLTRHKIAPYEVYNDGRFIATTGNSYGEERDVRTVTPEEALRIIEMVIPQTKKETDYVSTVSSMVENFSDTEIIRKMFAAKNGDSIKALHDGDISKYKDDASSGDMALCSHLAFWTNKNITQMERIWLASPLGSREKTEDRKDYRDRTIQKAVSNCKEVYKIKNTEDSKIEENNKGGTQTDKLLEVVGRQKNMSFFHDGQSNAYVAIEISGHQEIWPCKSKTIRRWLTNEFWKAEEKALGAEAVKSVVAVLEAIATFDGQLHELSNRATWSNEELWYDLTNDEWQAIKINERGWEVVDTPPILFRRYSHNKSQVMPVQGGDAELFLKYVTIKDPQQQLLLMVSLISYFIPGFPHPITVVFGAQGSAKSTLSKLLRQIIDPSSIEVASLPDKHKELVQALAHHYFLFFDNVSHISESTSDTLCKAVTGSGFIKREMYSDDEDIIYNLKRCMGINSINLIGTRPDLLERSLLLELSRIEPEDRKMEQDLMADFEGDLPFILGGVFDVLVKAIKIKPTIKLTSAPRMADFASWGSAIAEALGRKKEDFLDAYQANIDNQTEVAINENVVASVVISFMGDKKEWTGTAEKLLKELTDKAIFSYVDTHERFWPKAANLLMRRMNELKVNLKTVGILFSSASDGKIREITIRNINIVDGNSTEIGTVARKLVL